MSTRQSKQQQATASKQAVTTGVDSSFTPLDLDVPSINWEKTPNIVCTIHDTDFFIGKDGGKRLFIVDVNGEHMRLFEQPGLRRLFDKVSIGDTVAIQAGPMRPLAGNRSMRTYSASVRKGPRTVPAFVERPVDPALVSRSRGSTLPADIQGE